MATVASGNAVVSYRAEGEGRGLVLVHGTGGSGLTTWGQLLPILAPERRVVVPDLRGSGATRDPGDALELGDLAADVLAVASQEGLERFDLVGFSLGATVAVAAAAAAADRVESLVLIAGAPSGLDPRSRLQFGLWRDLFELDPKLFARYWLLTGFSPEFIAQIPVEGLERAATFPLEPGTPRQSDLSARADVSAELDGIRARTLVIGCAHDTIIPPQRSRELAEAIPAAQYVELAAGHMAVLEAPQDLAATIRRFLDAGTGAG